MDPHSPRSRRSFLGFAARAGAMGAVAMGAGGIAALPTRAGAQQALDPSLQVVPVPQWRGLPLVVTGHSLTILAPWHTPGAHWTQLVAQQTGPANVTRRGIGGAHMEHLPNVMTGASGWRWAPGPTKSLLVVLGVANSASNLYGGLERSVESIRRAATALMVTAISDGYDPTHPAWSLSAGTGEGWSVLATAYGPPTAFHPAGAAYYTANDRARAEFTVPAGVVDRHVWIETVAFHPAATVPWVQVRRNGLRLFHDPVGTTDLPAGQFSKRMIHAGRCSAGDVVRVDKVGPGGILWLTGAHVDNGRNHTLMIGDHDNAENPIEPITGQVNAHNAALGTAVAELNALVPGSCTFLDLAGDLTHTPEMLSGDGAHPNDLGMTWLAARISQGARALLPWTPRLHAV